VNILCKSVEQRRAIVSRRKEKPKSKPTQKYNITEISKIAIKNKRQMRKQERARIQFSHIGDGSFTSARMFSGSTRTIKPLISHAGLFWGPNPTTSRKKGWIL
jgi:hypothetical protein